MSYLTITDAHNSHIETINKANYDVMLQLMEGLKDICKIYFSAIYEGWVKKLHDVYKQMYPENSKAAYYTQLSRCRASIKQILKEKSSI